jgi:hypothetical protein
VLLGVPEGTQARASGAQFEGLHCLSGSKRRFCKAWNSEGPVHDRVRATDGHSSAIANAEAIGWRSLEKVDCQWHLHSTSYTR